jgi:IS30 family transposase
VCPINLDEPSARYLTLTEREEIAIGLACGESIRSIARRLGRAPGSPEEITGRLPLDFPDDEQMRISHETIYRALYVQGRGGLRRELASCLRTGRAVRKPRGRRAPRAHDKIPDKVMISQRPAEADDRAVPGHWEGDVLIGANNLSALGTLVERSTRFTLLLPLPHGYDAVSVRDAIIPTITALPAHLRRSLAWDQGSEMARHTDITIAADLPIYFCDPASPGSTAATRTPTDSGLLRGGRLPPPARGTVRLGSLSSGADPDAGVVGRWSDLGGA